jgi:hypothetical protein
MGARWWGCNEQADGRATLRRKAVAKALQLPSPAVDSGKLGAVPSAVAPANSIRGEKTMNTIGDILLALAGIGQLVCFILVVVKMFQRGQSMMGILCIVLFFCCYIGGLVAFIYGWVKSREWGITNIMYVWTGCWLVTVIGYGLHPVDLRTIQLPGP